jgi:hypothetical protein
VGLLSPVTHPSIAIFRPLQTVFVSLITHPSTAIFRPLANRICVTHHPPINRDISPAANRICVTHHPPVDRNISLAFKPYLFHSSPTHRSQYFARLQKLLEILRKVVYNHV